MELSDLANMTEIGRGLGAVTGALWACYVGKVLSTKVQKVAELPNQLKYPLGGLAVLAGIYFTGEAGKLIGQYLDKIF